MKVSESLATAHAQGPCTRLTGDPCAAAVDHGVPEPVVQIEGAWLPARRRSANQRDSSSQLGTTKRRICHIVVALARLGCPPGVSWVNNGTVVSPSHPLPSPCLTLSCSPTTRKQGQSLQHPLSAVGRPPCCWSTASLLVPARQPSARSLQATDEKTFLKLTALFPS